LGCTLFTGLLFTGLLFTGLLFTGIFFTGILFTGILFTGIFLQVSFYRYLFTGIFLPQPWLYLLILILMKNSITTIIDFFYPPFKRIMPLQTFRYAACGGGNVVLGFLIFSCIYHFVVQRKVVDLGFAAFESYSIALFCSSITVFIIGFLLNKYVVFTSSNLKGRIQLFRYFLSFISNLCINYVLLKALIIYLFIHPVLAQLIVTSIVVTISYFTQQYFTFKVKEEKK